MQTADAYIHVDYATAKPTWKIKVGYDAQLPLKKGEKMYASVLSVTPPLNDTAFGLRPLWLFFTSHSIRYEVQFERDGSCRISYSWPALEVDPRSSFARAATAAS